MLLSSSTSRGNIDEIAYLDATFGATEGATPLIPSGSLLTVRGWATLVEDPGGAAGVFVKLDDGPLIEIVHGIERQDVAAALGDEIYALTGFRGILSTSHLPFGTHHIAVAIRNADGALVSIGEPLPFTIAETLEQRLIAAPGPTAATPIVLDEINIGLRTATIPIAATQDDVVHLRGWAIDEPEHALATAVYAVVGSRAIRATYGDDREDVAKQYQDERLRKCGFTLEIPLELLSPGQHAIRLRVVGAGEHVIYEGQRIAIDVAPFVARGAASPGGLPTLGVVDKAAIFDTLGNIVNPPTPLTLARGQQLFLGGWAIDEPNDSVARAIHICVDGVVSTPAVYGIERRDVAQHFHRPDLAECGFTALIATASMPAGPHAAVIRVIDRAGTRYYDLEQRVDFTVVES